MSYCFSADAREMERAYSWLEEYWNRPARPAYYAPKTIGEALSILEEYGEGARILAGGIDVVGLMKKRLMDPRALVNIKSIPRMDAITETPRTIEIGALATISAIERSDLVRRKLPLLSEAAQSIGSPQIRAMGTLAGNFCQQVRCWYYRRSPFTGISFDCRRKREGGICFAVNGESDNHAILGGSSCFSVCPSDMATALLALDARIHTSDRNGGRSIPIARFYTDLGHSLSSREIATGIEIPKPDSSAAQRYIKVRVRKTIDFSLVSVASVIASSDGLVRGARIVLGGVSPAPYEAVWSERCLEGGPLTEETAAEAARESVRDAMPLGKNGYKVQMAEALVKRAILGVGPERSRKE